MATHSELAEAVERNHCELLRLEGQLPWVEFADDGDALRLFAGDTWPRNQVALARFTSATAHERIEQILEPHFRRKVACNWIIGPASQPNDLGAYLRAHGFHCMIHCAGMASNLRQFPKKPITPPKIRIEPADEPPSLVPLTTERRRARARGAQLVAQMRPRKVWHWVAWHDDKPIGMTVLCAGTDVAGLYGVEVLEKFRRRGIGSALVYIALCQAKELGFDSAVLSATGMGKSIYQRLGFNEVCKLSFWKYGKMRQLR